MAVKTRVSLDEYLGMSFEHDREYVNGEIVERAMPTFEHGDIQGFLDWYFRSRRRTTDLYVAREVRVRTAAGVIRIPDLSVFVGRPAEIPSEPALIVIEITSPDDRVHDVIDKLAEYRQWGVQHIWLVQANRRTLYVYEAGSLIETAAFQVPEYEIRIAASEIFP